MKRTIIMVMLLSALTVSAQEAANYRGKAPQLYCTADFSFSGGDYQGFAGDWSVFLPVTCDFVLMNRQSTRNYVEQGTLGR